MSPNRPRILSLLPSATEIVCALGMEESLVGRSHECDYPPSVTKLPACTEAKIDTDASSYQIDQSVRSLLEQGLSLYQVDADKLRSLRPDIIITQTQCAVCGVSEEQVEAAVKESLESKPRVVSLSANALADIWEDFRCVAQALEIPAQGEELVKKFQDRITAIAEKSAPLPKLRLMCLEWLDPIMAAGNWMPELIARAGGENLVGTEGEHSPQLSWGDLIHLNPDVILCMPCGYDMARTQRELPVLTTRPMWSDLKAVQNQRVYIGDGNQYFNRPGPRLVETLEILAEILHPDTFHFGHEGKGWISLYK